MKNKKLKKDIREQSSEKLKFIAKSTSLLSLGISMVVAVLMGVALGIFLRNITGINALLFVGVFFGIGASFLNVYKVYKSQVAEYEEEKD